MTQPSSFVQFVHRWYRAERHRDSIVEYMHQRAGVLERALWCIDVFGASGRVMSTWQGAGFASAAFDIKLSPDHDLTSKTGFECLISMGLQIFGWAKLMFLVFFSCVGVIWCFLYVLCLFLVLCFYHHFRFVYIMRIFVAFWVRIPSTNVSHKQQSGTRLLDGGILVCAPPCSLFSGACASVHRRTKRNPFGNRKNFKVRLAERIWRNWVSCSGFNINALMANDKVVGRMWFRVWLSGSFLNIIYHDLSRTPFYSSIARTWIL